MILNGLISDIDIEKRKEVIRNVINYDLENVDHIPILITYYPNTYGYTLKDIYTNKEIQLEFEMDKIRNTLKRVPDDYIPTFKSDLGYVVTQSIFGLNVVYSELRKPAKIPDHTPYVDPKTKPIKSLKDIYRFKRPDNILNLGLVPNGIETVRYLMQQTNYEIPTSCLDIGNGLLMAYELTETYLFFETMKDDPKAIQYLNDILTGIVIDLADAVIEAAGGIKNMTSTEWDDKWYPDGKKCFISSEMQVLYNPNDYPIFDLPYCNKQFKHFGPGFLHNCGPQTAITHFWSHEPKPYGLTCEYYSSLNDFQEIKTVLNKNRKAILYVEFNNIRDSEEMVKAFKYLMDIFAPDVIAIPYMWVGPVHICQDEPEKIYNALLPISKDYMNKVKEGLSS